MCLCLVVSAHTIILTIWCMFLQLNKVSKETQFSWLKRQLKQLVDKVGVALLVVGVALLVVRLYATAVLFGAPPLSPGIR